jgi:hypothetical protein
VAAFICLPIALDPAVKGYFIVWLKANQALPTPDQLERAASMPHLALQALRASDRIANRFQAGAFESIDKPNQATAVSC